MQQLDLRLTVNATTVTASYVGRGAGPTFIQLLISIFATCRKRPAEREVRKERTSEFIFRSEARVIRSDRTDRLKWES